MLCAVWQSTCIGILFRCNKTSGAHTRLVRALLRRHRLLDSSSIELAEITQVNFSPALWRLWYMFKHELRRIYKLDESCIHTSSCDKALQLALGIRGRQSYLRAEGSDALESSMRVTRLWGQSATRAAISCRLWWLWVCDVLLKNMRHAL